MELEAAVTAIFSRHILARSLIIALIFSNFHGVASAQTRTDAELEQAIQDVIIQRHPTDTPEWWRELGPEAPRVIIGMAEKAPRLYQRLRLVEALGWFDDQRAVEYLKRQADSASNGVIRNAAVKAIGNSQGAKELEFVSKFLKHSDPQTRKAAAQAVHKINAPKLKSFESQHGRVKGEPSPRPLRRKN
jgi:hypothetical protein